MPILEKIGERAPLPPVFWGLYETTGTVGTICIFFYVHDIVNKLL